MAHDWYEVAVYDRRSLVDSNIEECEKQVDCVEKDKVDGHEELESLASLPPSSSPQGVGDHLPHDTVEDLDNTQVFQFANLQKQEQEGRETKSKRKEKAEPK